MKFNKLVASAMVLLLLSACSSGSPFKSLMAGDCSTAQKQAVNEHISSQISAISKEDWPLAYSFASQFFQDSVDIFSFEAIITSSYPMLINSQGITFGKCEIKNSAVFQEITVDSNNEKSELLYKLSVVDQKLGVDAANIMEPSAALTT